MLQKSPVLFLIFNRPEHTQRVFDEIRRYQPSQLFVAADGPRKDRVGEDVVCKKTREIVLQHIDWPCEVHTLLRNENMGCKYAVSSAIDWFFSVVEEGVILEDDCVPDQSFFRFCGTLLEKYRHDSRVMHIGGTNFHDGEERAASFYYFTHFPRVWGWATWRRAWKLYDRDLVNYHPYSFSYPKHRFHSVFSRLLWDQSIHRTQLGQIDTWDYQWMHTIWHNDALSIAPTRNLIANVGFGKGATHTTSPHDFRAYVKIVPMSNADFAKPNCAFVVNVDADTDYETKIAKRSVLSACRIIVLFFNAKLRSSSRFFCG